MPSESKGLYHTPGGLVRVSSIAVDDVKNPLAMRRVITRRVIVVPTGAFGVWKMKDAVLR